VFWCFARPPLPPPCCSASLLFYSLLYPEDTPISSSPTFTFLYSFLTSWIPAVDRADYPLVGWRIFWASTAKPVAGLIWLCVGLMVVSPVSSASRTLRRSFWHRSPRAGELDPNTFFPSFIDSAHGMLIFWQCFVFFGHQLVFSVFFLSSFTPPSHSGCFWLATTPTLLVTLLFIIGDTAFLFLFSLPLILFFYLKRLAGVLFYA